MRWLQVAAASLCLLLLIASVLLFGFRFSQAGPCEKGSIPCTTSPSICIPQRSWCNDYVDCPNGDDEIRKDCADFSGSKDVLDTLISSRKPPSMESQCVLEGYPGACRCKRTSVNCGGAGLPAVPTGILGNITRIILLNNSIGSLDKTSFEPYATLEMINLHNNTVTSIREGTFSGKTKLEKLLLSRNRLSQWSVAPGEMVDLSSLVILILDSNALTDESWPLDQLGALRSLQWLSLSKNSLRLSDQEFPRMTSLKDLNLSRNSLTHVTERTFMRLEMLALLDLSHNAIEEIHPAAFSSLFNLQELSFAYNYLHYLPDHLFDSLGLLDNLDLSGNPLHIPGHLFYPLQNITSISLMDIDIDNIDIQMFSALPNLSYVNFKFYYYCSFVPHVPNCKPNHDGVSSMEDLLHALPLRLTVWGVAAFTFCANVLVLSGRAYSNDDNRVLSLVIRSLAAADLLMGVYLTAIASADEMMRGVYHRRAYDWMTSWACTLAGITSMLSSEVSVMTLVFMSLDRFLLIADPLGRNLMSFDSSAKSVTAIWASGLVLAVLPVAVHWRTNTRFYGTNGMCLPLHIDDPYLVGWQYSTFVFLGVNGASSLLLIAFLYLGMFLSIVRTRRATPLAVGDVDVAVRFFFIVLTDACCWAPIAIMKILALCRVHISAEVYAWVVVFLVPVNSAINPLLYTLTIPKYSQAVVRLARRGVLSCWGRALSSRRQSAETECSHSNRPSATTSRTPIECSDFVRKTSGSRPELPEPIHNLLMINSEEACF